MRDSDRHPISFSKFVRKLKELLGKLSGKSFDPEQYTVINGHLIAEFYESGRYVVYVDNVFFDGSYEAAIAAMKDVKWSR